MNLTILQVIRYGVVGVLSNTIGYILYLVITFFGTEHKLAMTLLYVLGVMQTFIFNKRWSFRDGGAYGPALVRYCITYGFGYFINLTALFVFVDFFGYRHQIVQGILVLSLAVILFLLQKFWVFRSITPQAATAKPEL